MSKVHFSIIPMLFVLLGCGHTNVEIIEIRFDRGKMLERIHAKVIVPNHDTLHQQSIQFKTSIVNFTNLSYPSISDLADIQQNWADLSISWKKCELFNIGAIKDSYTHNKIEANSVNEKFIQDYLQSGEIISSEIIDSKGSSAKGLKTLEFFLFSKNQNNDSIIYRFSDSDSLGFRRKQYIRALAENLETQCSKLDSLWREQNGYSIEFIENDGTEISSSTSQMFNSMVALIENIYQTKLGKPLGKNDLEGIRPNLLESPLSRTSLENIQSNLDAIQSAYFGSENMRDTNRIGMDDYLAISQSPSRDELIKTISLQFEHCQLALDNITPPLSDALTTDKLAVEQAYHEFEKLLILFKTDLASNLGITLYFNDNDGD